MSRRKYLSRENFVFPSEFDGLLYSTGTTTARAAKLLNRTRRTVHDWRTGRRPVPKWAFQLVYYASLDLPALQLERIKWRRWVDLRPYFGAPANDGRFLQANQQPAPASAPVPPDAVPKPDAVGSAGRPGRGHQAGHHSGRASA